jgi:HAD superfamily hydrolase (TIGR01509 family)
MTMSGRQALIFDVGDVLTVPAFVLLDRLERVVGRPIEGRGPLGPGIDRRWEQLQAGEISTEQYWNGVAEQAGLGTWREFYGLISREFPVDMFDPIMLAFADAAQAAGYLIGVLTNDMVAINGANFAATSPIMARFDAIIDATELGFRKPAPQAYAAICAALDVAPASTVFLDDTPACVDGALAFGMRAVLVDTFDRAPAIRLAGELLAEVSP